MDIQASVGLGIRRRLYSVDCSIRVWFLQHYVNFHHSRLYYNASLQASFVVRLLSYGNNDAVNLQSKKQIVKTIKVIKTIRKNTTKRRSRFKNDSAVVFIFYFLLFYIFVFIAVILLSFFAVSALFFVRTFQKADIF